MPIVSIERECFMYYNKNSSISSSRGVFLKHLTFKYSQNCVHRGCGYGGKLFELRKEEARKEKSSISSSIVRGYPQVSACGGLGPATGPMWITHERWYMYQWLSGEVDSYKFYLLTKLPLFIR
ncbi:hypothetical protein LCGC14_1447230 [marine sediment metagenome]|uniref:Uncharacterized protein n=1 Tax=marine sediment metagenome TaxID=412755 RepID=A0A0F9MKT2_9ZZZZ